MKKNKFKLSSMLIIDLTKTNNRLAKVLERQSAEIEYLCEQRDEANAKLHTKRKHTNKRYLNTRKDVH
jgi:hypothetical protein